MTSLPGPISFHPILVESSVFVGFEATSTESGGVARLDIDDGSSVWTTSLSAHLAAPLAAGSHLIVSDQDGEVVALDFDHGGVRWRSPSPARPQSQPAVVGEAVYSANSSGQIRRIDMADGGTVWTVDLGSPVITPVVAVSGQLLVGTLDGRVLSLGAP